MPDCNLTGEAAMRLWFAALIGVGLSAGIASG